MLSSVRPRLNLRPALLWSLGACLWLLGSCGGGLPGGTASSTGNGSGVGSGGTGSYTNGPISGLGSIIVNGVRYDVGAAEVLSDDGEAHSASELNLGMQVEVSGDAVVTGVATAAQVRFASALVGPVEQALDSGCSCLLVLGQKVLVQGSTAMAPGVKVGDVVEVFGQADLADARRQLVATRVQPVTDGRPYKLLGWVSGPASVTATTVTVQGPSSAITVSYSSDSQIEALDDLGSRGRAVRVWLQAGSGPTYPLTRLTVDSPLVADRDEARLEGRITQVLDLQTQLMGVNGVLVDVSAVLNVVRALTVGQALRVEGALVKGVLKVAEVTLRGEGGGEGEGEGDEIELHGRPESGSFADVDANQATFNLRGVTVLYARSLAPANLTSLGCVEVEGSGFNAQGQLVATRIKADDDCH